MDGARFALSGWVQRIVTWLLGLALILPTVSHAQGRGRRASVKRRATSAKAHAKHKKAAPQRASSKRAPKDPVALRRFLTAGASARRLPRLNLKARAKLKFIKGSVSAKQSAAFQKFVATLEAQRPGEVILFRGQERRTARVQSSGARGVPMTTAIREFKKAEAKEDAYREKVVAEISAKTQRRDPTVSERAKLKLMESIGGKERLAIRHQNQLGGKYFVSASRDLGIAMGDYYKGSPARFVYVLSVPRDQVINTYGAVSAQARILRQLQPNNQREKEVAIPLDATQYVRGVYDLKKNKFVPLKGAEGKAP